MPYVFVDDVFLSILPPSLSHQFLDYAAATQHYSTVFPEVTLPFLIEETEAMDFLILYGLSLEYTYKYLFFLLV